jgi:hypothetical protein
MDERFLTKPWLTNNDYNTQKMVQLKRLQNSYVQTNNNLTGVPLKRSKFRLNKDLSFILTIKKNLKLLKKEMTSNPLLI